MGDGKMKIGLNVFADDIMAEKPSFAVVTDNGKLIDYAVCHIEGRNYTLAGSVAAAEKLASFFASSDTDFIANFEYQNWAEECTAEDGCAWADDSDGCHIMKLPREFVAALNRKGNFLGVMYDEFEHMIIHRNPTIQINTKLKKILPAFPLYKGKDAVAQGELLTEQLKEYAGKIKADGAPAMFGEHVFPVLFHKFAESGIVPNFKSLKETYTDIQYSVAAGAALQYGLPLSTCIDNWFMLTNPGHSAEEMYNNLLFAWFSGVDLAYVESIKVMTEDGGDSGVLTEHGKAFRRFCEEYKDKERGYSSEDLRPEIGIIRYDDTYWGQWYPVLFKKCLFGNANLKPDYRSKEYFKVFNLLTHGETCKNGITWGRFSPWSLRPHKSFASLNSTVVFDHSVRKPTLDSLKLCFLCGIHISSETLEDVRKCVRENGLTAVSAARFVPSDIKDRVTGGCCEVKDGKGKWIVVRSFRSGKLKKLIKPFIGKKGEIRLTFADREIVLGIKEKGNAVYEIGK